MGENVSKLEYRRNREVKPDSEFPAAMQRVALGVEYDGSKLNGFQKQTSTLNTVQGYLEKALSQVANEPITLVCAGRTDAGVHATGQVIHFDTLAIRPDKAWVMGVNTNLPSQVRVRWIKNVSSEFHARFSALNRSYRYVIYPGPTQLATMNKIVTHVPYSLNAQTMNAAAQYLRGSHDFSSFRAAHCQANSSVRTISNIEVYQRGHFVVVDITANAFLYHMVRNIVGALLIVGQGQQQPMWIAQLLSLKSRSAAPPTASAYGLYLTEVGYPPELIEINEISGPYFL